MPLREIIAYVLIAGLVFAVIWGLWAMRRHYQRERDIMRGKIRLGSPSSRRRKD